MGPEQEGSEGDVERGEGDPSLGIAAAGILGLGDSDYESIAQGMLGIANGDSDSDSDD